MANKAEAARRQKAEAELRRVGEQLAYSRGEAKHLKARAEGQLQGCRAAGTEQCCDVQATWVTA